MALRCALQGLWMLAAGMLMLVCGCRKYAAEIAHNVSAKKRKAIVERAAEVPSFCCFVMSASCLLLDPQEHRAAACAFTGLLGSRAPDACSRRSAMCAAERERPQQEQQAQEPRGRVEDCSMTEQYPVRRQGMQPAHRRAVISCLAGQRFSS